MVSEPVWRTDKSSRKEIHFCNPCRWLRDWSEGQLMVRKLAERLAAAWRHSGCSGKGDWRWHPMAERLLGCAGRLVDRQHGVHCGALLARILHGSLADRIGAQS